MDGSLARKTILIVEDDNIISDMMKVKFKNAGFSVLTAFNGDEGIKLALSQHPDLITLDLLMPVKDGIVFMDEIRRDEWGKNVPIIILTNFDSNDYVISKVEESKPSYYLIKSSTKIENILDKIKEILKI